MAADHPSELTKSGSADAIRAVRYDSDNYAWILAAESGNVIVIDPGSVRAIEAALANAHKNPIAFLCTHSDSDHIMGLAALAGKYPQASIAVHHGFAAALPPGARVQHCHDNEVLQFGAMRITCMETPGHSGDSMCFLTDDGALFTGDTLFAAGCGRVRGNGYDVMLRSLCRIAALPPDTRVYPGHDYLEENLRFTATMPHDAKRIGSRRAALAEGREPPSTLALELATNPFLRAMDPEFRKSLRAQTAPEAFTLLRRRKNSFI
ncbi:MAG: hydroxyacylglutathione hydrolase [Spirochaetota bacterium]|jgi:hydroxyacylglutathione hydrolase|nr:hydroxyacylglutathione hydrolase [Spirochaetota bacterium]